MLRADLGVAAKHVAFGIGRVGLAPADVRGVVNVPAAAAR